VEPSLHVARKDKLEPVEIKSNAEVADARRVKALRLRDDPTLALFKTERDPLMRACDAPTDSPLPMRKALRKDSELLHANTFKILV
jgi:hypothetical protein